jgi:hypothetical protein
MGLLATRAAEAPLDEALSSDAGMEAGGAVGFGCRKKGEA